MTVLTHHVLLASRRDRCISAATRMHPLIFLCTCASSLSVWCCPQMPVKVVPEEESPPVVPRGPRLMAADVEGDYVSVTSAGGLRVYCGVAPPAEAKAALPGGAATAGLPAGLLGRAGGKGGQQRLLKRPIADMLRVCGADFWSA